MQSSGTLLDYLTIVDVIVFVGVPLCLLTIVLAQQLLAGRATSSFGGSYSRRPTQAAIMKDPEARSAPGK